MFSVFVTVQSQPNNKFNLVPVIKLMYESFFNTLMFLFSNNNVRFLEAFFSDFKVLTFELIEVDLNERKIEHLSTNSNVLKIEH